ncbi:ornithine carbamoyltransferase [Tuanshanicoccus lijuaniae]|uniref:ornithine carbamoyltransferase n=1 Tax=Aerococcaceae bacterium zg-1292 TaxID=2774330 RepID=UPI0019CB6D5A|nr:ornithine carbamoyltransferase [Aerococcaceae bacterium zg-1292]MBF6625126.1 ornithine carbamoyltransferase [Aerococcaceae bacterium zg-BR9]MBF6978254.1 ornithine carbamoyltransferase [Aerococcaceae bacterium zg-BR22]
MNLTGRNYLKLLDFTNSEMRHLLDMSKDFKALKRAGVPHKYLEGKNIVLLFEKTSTRTRCSFEVAGYDLGMGVTFLDPQSSQMGHKESIKDTARVLGRMYDGIEYRGFSQEIVQELADYAGVPVWNGLTDEFHPTQMLADMLTIEEHFGHLKGINFVYMGDARNNMANSLMIACAKMGVNFTACSTEDLFPEESLIETAKEIAKETGSVLKFETDPMVGTKDADVIYTDIWVSMGEPAEIWEARINKLLPYQVNKKIMENASKDAIFLHCLPSFHDLKTKVGQDINEKFGIPEMEVTDEVFESYQSKVFDQAENRMHTIKAVMYATLK